MIEVRQTAIFIAWFNDLRDIRAQAKVAVQIRRLTLGNFGSVRSLDDGVSEIKINYGPGYRLYFTRRGLEIVVLLCGGDKGSQKRDIRDAKEIAKEIE